MTRPTLAEARRQAEEALYQWYRDKDYHSDRLAPKLAALLDATAGIKESLKAGPTIPDGDLGWDAIAYARDIVADPKHHDADEFSGCAKETLMAVLARFDRLVERHDTLFRRHAELLAVRARLPQEDEWEGAE